MAQADGFDAWYSRMSAQYGLPSNPDDPSQFYDYRAAFKAGASPDASGHWPSTFKKSGHPNEIVGGFNTRTGEPEPGYRQETNVQKLVQLGWEPATAKQLVTKVATSTQNQQKRPFVADPNEWEVVDDLQVVDDTTEATPPERKPFSWSDELGLNTPTDSRVTGFLKGAGGAAVDMVQGAAAPTAQLIYEGGDLIRRNLGMERVIERPEVQAAMDAPNTVAGKIGEYGPAAAGVAQAGTAIATKAIPSAARAGQTFKDVMGAAKNVPVDLKAPGDVALRIMDLADRGGSMPKAVRDFLKLSTDPNKQQMTYEVARDLASNISRLSVNEFQRLTPVMAREVANLRVALNESVAKAAQAAGKGAEYKSAMSEYARAMRLRDAVDEVVKSAKKGVPYATGAGVGYWLTRKITSALGGQ